MAEDHLRFLLGDDLAARFLEAEDDDPDLRTELADHFSVGRPASTGDAGLYQGALSTMRQIVLSQLADESMPAASQAVDRLREAGHEPQRILDQLALALAETLTHLTEDNDTLDIERYARALDALPLPLPDVVDAANALLAVVRNEQGIDVEELLAAARIRLGIEENDSADSLLDRTFDKLVDGPLAFIHDDGVVLPNDLVAGRTFTHRLTEIEVELGVITAVPDLSPMRCFTRLATRTDGDGDEWTEIELLGPGPGPAGWIPPTQWFEGRSAGDLLALSVDPVASETAEFRLDVVGQVHAEFLAEEPSAPEPLLDALRSAHLALEAGDPGYSVGADEIVWSVLVNDPTALTAPALPLGELLAQAGLEVRGGRVASDDTVWRNERHHQMLLDLDNHPLDDAQRRSLRRALPAIDDPTSSDEVVRHALASCADPELLDVAADILIPEPLDLLGPPAPLGSVEDTDGEHPSAGRREFPLLRETTDLVERCLAVARKNTEVATAEYLAGILAERTAEPVAAEAHFRASNVADPHIGCVVERLGWYAFDRGDAHAAAKWWNGLVEPHESLKTIQPFLRGDDSAKIGRNDPCWCGSGKKFKKCHQGNSALPPLPERLGWVARKATVWIEHAVGSRRDLPLQCAIAYAAAEADPDAIDFEDDPDLLYDVQTAFADPLIFDVALHEGGMFHEFLAERGELLPEDEQLLVASWLTIARSVHEMVDVDPGVGITARNLATGDTVEVRERLGSTQMQVGDRWCGRVVPDGSGHQFIGGVFPVPVGTEEYVLELCDLGDPYELCAWAGSLQQPPRIEYRPGMIEEMFDMAAVQATIDQLGQGATDDEIQAAFRAEMSRQASENWLDEHVPALGGLTPRQAAADPTRRDDVSRLLDDFDDRSRAFESMPTGGDGGLNPFTYDIAGMRRELGLD